MAVVPTGPIEDHHSMGISGDLAADLAEVMVHRGGIADRHDQRRRLALRRADRTKPNRPRRSRDLLAPPAGCRFAPTPGSSCSSGQCEPRPETIPRLAYRALAPPGLALIAIQQFRNLRLRRRIGLRVARARRQPAQLYPMQQPVGARQAAINRKLFLQYALRIDRTKRHYPIPLQLGAGDNPFLEPRACHGVHPWLSTRARPVTQSLNAFLFVAVMPFVSRRPAQPSQPRRFLMLHPLEQVRDHQNPLADTPALVPCQAPQLGRPRFAAKKVCWHRLSPKHGTLA